jgi:hypothetical protein
MGKEAGGLGATFKAGLLYGGNDSGIFLKPRRYGWRFVSGGLELPVESFRWKKERLHNEIGAPDFRIFVPSELS